MRLQYGERAHIGFQWEDKIADRLRKMGHDVTVMARNNRFDLLVNESIRVDVKAISYVEYKGSDGYPIRGWIASNMSKPPTCDYYIMVCLDETRTREVKTYVIPATLLNQTSLTITSKDKFFNYIDAYNQFDHMKKKAHLQPVGFNNRGEANKPDVEKKKIDIGSIFLIGASSYLKTKVMSGSSITEFSGIGKGIKKLYERRTWNRN